MRRQCTTSTMKGRARGRGGGGEGMGGAASAADDANRSRRPRAPGSTGPHGLGGRARGVASRATRGRGCRTADSPAPARRARRSGAPAAVLSPHGTHLIGDAGSGWSAATFPPPRRPWAVPLQYRYSTPMVPIACGRAEGVAETLAQRARRDAEVTPSHPTLAARARRGGACGVRASTNRRRTAWTRCRADEAERGRPEGIAGRGWRTG